MLQLAALTFFFACLQAGLAKADTITVTVVPGATYLTPTTLATTVRVEAQNAATTAATTYSAYNPTSTEGVDSDGGASGNDHGSFQISQGAIIAIIVVCVCVVIFGIASTVLFVVAKRRQWNVRASIARASRRLTGRFGSSKSRPQDVERRAGVMPGVKAVMPPGHKRGLVVEVQPMQQLGGRRIDPLAGRAPQNTRPREKTWVKNLWGGTWK